MKIEINPNETIVSIKKQFHTYFPNLKIELFKADSNEEGASSRELMLDNATELSTLLKGAATDIEFEAKTTVSAFENSFKEQLGLHVQVFRKSGPVYLETITTDAWSLQQQNDEGKPHADEDGGEPKDMTDRDKWE